MSVVQIGLLLLASFFLMLALSVPVSISLIVSSLITVSTALPLDLGTFVAAEDGRRRRQLLAARRSLLHPDRRADEHRRYRTKTD